MTCWNTGNNPVHKKSSSSALYQSRLWTYQCLCTWLEISFHHCKLQNKWSTNKPDIRTARDRERDRQRDRQRTYIDRNSRTDRNTEIDRKRKRSSKRERQWTYIDRKAEMDIKRDGQKNSLILFFFSVSLIPSLSHSFTLSLSLSHSQSIIQSSIFLIDRIPITVGSFSPDRLENNGPPESPWENRS